MPNPSNVDVHKIGRGVIPRASAVQRQSDIAELGRTTVCDPDINGHRLHVQAVLCDTVSVAPQVLITPRRSVTANNVNFGIWAA
jgi:hypothetical protein